MTGIVTALRRAVAANQVSVRVWGGDRQRVRLLRLARKIYQAGSRLVPGLCGIGRRRAQRNGCIQRRQ